MGSGKQVIAVGNLLALAARVFAQAARLPHGACAFDARMHEAYCAVYQRGTEILEVQRTAAGAAARTDELAREWTPWREMR